MRGERDWWALAVPVVAIAAVVGVGSLTSSGSSKQAGPETALGPGGGTPGAEARARHRKKEEKEKAKKALAPTGKLHKIHGTVRHPEASSEQIAKSGYQQIPSADNKGKPGESAGKGEAGKGGNGKGGKAPTGKIHKGAGGKAGGGEQSGQNKSSADQKKEKEHPTIGFNVKGQKKGGNGRPGTSEVSGAGNKKSAPNGQQDEQSSSTSESGGQKGVPTGAGKAGGEQGNNSQGHATPIKGQASQAVKIQPGYAPSRSSKGGKEHKKPGTQEGGGGKARTAQVTGATQVGSEFSFVPAAGGALPGAGPGLQQNYTESLKWVERLPW